MIFKVNQEQLETLLSEFYVPHTSCYYTGFWTEKFIGQNKVTLSVKQGKKRRLIAGKIITVGHESSRESSGYNILTFKPNNNTRLEIISDVRPRTLSIE